MLSCYIRVMGRYTEIARVRKWLTSLNNALTIMQSTHCTCTPRGCFDDVAVIT